MCSGIRSKGCVSIMRRIIRLFSKVLQAIKTLYYRIIYLEYKHMYDIPKDFRFNGDGILMYGDGIISIGQNSYIGRYSSVQSGHGCSVKIGDNCRIGHFVKIYTTTFYSDQQFNCRDVERYSKSVVVGDGVWIGANVFINPGVTIGNNSIIGANSVVTKDVPDDCIVGGTPIMLP